MVGCAAIGCSNRSEQGYVMKYFPREPSRRKLWDAKVKRDNWTPTDRSVLCEKHFEPSMWEKDRQDGKRKLKRDAIPTLFSFVTPTRKRKAPKERSIISEEAPPENLPPAQIAEFDLHEAGPSTSKALHESNHRKQLMSDTFKNEMNLLPDTVYVKADIDTDEVTNECVLTAHPIIKQEFDVLKDECIDIKEELPSNYESEPNTEDKPNDSSKPFPCTECNFRCKAKSNLKHHMRLHTGEKPFACTYCDYKCTLKYHLHRHIRMHTGEKPFVCNECSYKTTDKGKLREHTKRHTGEKRYSCTFCDYKCVSNCDMKRHIRKHTGEKPFACSECSYRAVGKSNLIEHMKRHTGRKPFTCTYCDYRSVNKYDLCRHVRTHTGERPFPCSKCPYRGTTQAKLKRHVATHDTFLCYACNFKTTRKSTLTNHKKKCKVVDVRLPVEYVSIETNSEDIDRFLDESKQSEVLRETSGDVFKPLKQEIDVKEEPL